MPHSLDTDLATENSGIRVLLIKSREGWQIARECHGAQNQWEAAPTGV